MPRTSRSVAQRLASQGKSRKKRPRTPNAPTSPASPSVDQILDEVVPSAAGLRAASTPTVARPGTESAAAPAGQTAAPARTTGSPRSGRAGVTRTPGRPATVRRPYSDYGAEYAYVWADLRRIVVVAASLVVLLVVLSFFIQ